MKLNTDIELFKDAVTITAQMLSLPEIYVEKDYWVTLAIHQIFTSDVSELTILKGGTALAKTFSFINRFSEDIDLVALRSLEDSPNKLKARLKKITESIIDLMPEIEVDGITNKKGLIRKTAHSYSKAFSGEFGQVRDMIILEASWLGSYEPYQKGKISSMIYDMMVERNQEEIAKQYGLLPFEIMILSPTRTLCEKIMSLVRFSYTQSPIEDLKKKIRHTYDLHQLLQEADINAFFESEMFDKMMMKVAQDDKVSFKNNNDWLQFHPSQALLFRDLDNVWAELKQTYNGSFKALVYGSLPKDDLVLETLRKIKNRLDLLEWDIPEKL